MISVLIVDDQVLVREGLRMLLRAEPDIHVVGEAGDGIEAVAEADRLDPDVILMDVRMPRLDGIQAAVRLAQGGSRAKILMLTTFSLDQYVYDAMRAGASGFLLKDATGMQLVAAIKTVRDGGMLLASVVTRRLIEDFCGRPAPDGAAEAVSGLTEKELETVQFIAHGLSNSEMAAKLYLSEATIKSRIARVLTKLSLRDRVQVAIFAYEKGIVRPGSET